MGRYEEAVGLAIAAHAGQERAGTGLPYIVHPLAVADYLRGLGFGDNVVVAAVLHDTVEDTAVTSEQIARQFGWEVEAIVKLVTRNEGETYRQFIERLALSGNTDAIAVKVGDLKNNSADMPASKAGLKRRYDAALAILEPLVVLP